MRSGSNVIAYTSIAYKLDYNNGTYILKTSIGCSQIYRGGILLD